MRCIECGKFMRLVKTRETELIDDLLKYINEGLKPYIKEIDDLCEEICKLRNKDFWLSPYIKKERLWKKLN